MSDKLLSIHSLTGSEVQNWTEFHSGVKYVCFRNARGELFHFKANELRRGKPCSPFNTIEEFTRPSGFLTLDNAFNVSGCSPNQLKYYIKLGKLRAVKKNWRYGRIHRHGLLIDIKDLQEFMMKQAVEKYKGKLIEWDINPRELLK